jgi:hypothetical protein
VVTYFQASEPKFCTQFSFPPVPLQTRISHTASGNEVTKYFSTLSGSHRRLMFTGISGVLAGSIVRTMLVEAPSTYKTSVNFYQSTRRNNPEDINLQKTSWTKAKF